MSETTKAKGKAATEVAASKEAERKKAKRENRNNPQVVMLDPKNIVLEIGENPRFDVPGLTPNQVSGHYYASDEYKALANAFDTDGIEQPILVEPADNGRFKLIDGWTRTRWALDNKKKTIPAIVRLVDDEKERMTLRVAMNSARRDYEPLAQAKSFAKIIELWGSESAAAKQIGTTKSYMRQRLRLLKLPVDLQTLLAIKRITLNAIDTIMRYNGFEDWLLVETYNAGETKEEPGDAMLAKAEKFEKFLKHLIKIIKSDDGTYTYEDIVKLWNSFVSEEKEAATDGKKDKKGKDGEEEEEEDTTTDDILLVKPSKKAIEALLLSYGTSIAKNLMKSDGEVNEGRIARFVDRIEHLGTFAGQCVCSEARKAFEEADVNVMDEAVAQRLCDQFVRDTVLGAVCQLEFAKDREIPENHRLVSDEGWMSFLKKDQPLADAVAELRAAFGPAIAKVSVGEIAKEAEKRLKKKGKKSKKSKKEMATSK